MTTWPVHAKITGPIVMIGFGSIGKGTLPLIERHFDYDKSRMVVIDPSDKDKALLDKQGVALHPAAVTKAQLQEAAEAAADRRRRPGLLRQPLGRYRLGRHHGVLPLARLPLHRHRRRALAGFYFDAKLGRRRAPTTRCARRCWLPSAPIRAGRRPSPPAEPTPAWLSWFVKQALTNIATDMGLKFKEPKSREDWAALMKKAGVKGIHIAERDTQRAKTPKPPGVFVNTWSVEGFVSEGMQPAELGWGTHEKWMPKNGRKHKAGCGAAIYLLQPGANTRVRSWCPTPGPQYGFLVTHNEAISIADYYTVKEKKGKKAAYRPTCHYAYHPANDAVLSLHEMFGAAARCRRRTTSSTRTRSSTASTNSACCSTATRRTPTGMARSSRWRDPPHLPVSERHRHAGVLGRARRHGLGSGEPDRRHRRGRRDGPPTLPRVQTPYLGPVQGFYTDWTPLQDRPASLPRSRQEGSLAFRNILVQNEIGRVRPRAGPASPHAEAPPRHRALRGRMARIARLGPAADQWPRPAGGLGQHAVCRSRAVPADLSQRPSRHANGCGARRSRHRRTSPGSRRPASRRW